MAEPLDNPLSEKQFQDIQESLRRLDTAESLARKLANTGSDMTRELEKIAEQRGRLLAFKREFFPGR